MSDPLVRPTPENPQGDAGGGGNKVGEEGTVGQEGMASHAPTTLSLSSAADRKTAWLALFVYVAFNLVLPLLPVHPHRLTTETALALLVVPTAAFMLLQLWLSRALVGLRSGTAPSVCTAALCVAVWLAVLTLLRPHRGAGPVGLLPVEAALWRLGLGLAITLACTFFGIALSRIVREANVLLPVALVAMPIDYLGAMTPIGFTQNAVRLHPEVVRAVSVPVPTVGGLHPIGYIGPGDALFLAFFFAAVQRLGLNGRGTFWWMYGLLTATMLFVLVSGVNVAALIPMGLAVLIANGSSFRLKRAEVFATLYAALLVVALAAGFYAYSHAHFFRH